MNDKPHLDEEALAELRDVMEREFAVLIETYLNDSRERITMLGTALEARDAEEFRKTAHSFKGSCINIGAPKLGDLCFQAEQAARESRMEDCARCLELIETEFQAVKALFRDHFDAGEP